MQTIAQGEGKMLVTNNTSFQVIALGFDARIGYGNDLVINPGMTVDVQGPYVGEMGCGICYIRIDGKVALCEIIDGKNDLKIGKGIPVSIEIRYGRGVIVRHHEDPVDANVAEWRSTVSNR